MLEAIQYPPQLESALSGGVIKRLPLSFLPFVNQQLRQWETLFPNERNGVERLLVYVASLSEESSTALFRDVVAVEDKMGLRQWHFSTAEQTIENSSELARSPYFQEWRQAVQAVFDAAERNAWATAGSPAARPHRILLLECPAVLPVDPHSVWTHWEGAGQLVSLDLSSSDAHSGALAALLGGNGSFAGLLQGSEEGQKPQADRWVIDAGRDLVDSLAGTHASARGPLLLSYERLDPFRENFEREMNTMRKDLSDADSVFDRLRRIDVARWCPPEVAADAALREFVRSVYLSGNGAVIFGNSFVEWAASEAFRRARPSLLAARFGVRKRPKPFTGVAVFENPDRVNSLPAVDDFEGSAIDAEMLAPYVWLAAQRYPEYPGATVCICIAARLEQAWMVAPPEFALPAQAGPLTLDRLGQALLHWFNQA